MATPPIAQAGNMFASPFLETGTLEPLPRKLTPFNFLSTGPLEVIWVQQFGTDQDDAANSLVWDGLKSLYLVGYTEGKFGANAEDSELGKRDGWVAKLDTDGNFMWRRQFGSVDDDQANDVDLDSLGNLYIAGWTEARQGGDLGLQPVTFLASFDTDGTERWARQLPGDNAFWGWDVALDPADEVVVSSLNTLAKYDAAGNILWEINEFDSFNGAVADSQGNLYVARRENLSKHDPAGNLLWEVPNPPLTSSHDVAIDSEESLLFVGRTAISLAADNFGKDDIYLAKFDTEGNSFWTVQIGSEENEFVDGVTTDADNNIYISGRTEGSLADTNAGGVDAFVAKLNPDGALLWIHQFGTPADDHARFVELDGAGNLYLSGWTEGNLGDDNLGGQDAWVIKFTEPIAPPLAWDGTEEADERLGDSGDDALSGGDGNDRLRGLAGNDTLKGGSGDDNLLGGTGKDFIAAGLGNDLLQGQSDADILLGAAGDDILLGGPGDDFLQGDIGADQLIGGAGRNIVFGGPDADIFIIEYDVGFQLIADFSAEDRIGLVGGLTFADLTIVQSGGSSLLKADDRLLAQIASVPPHLLNPDQFFSVSEAP